MIYQNLAIALATTSTLAAAAPKASYYASQASGTTLDTAVKTYDARGFVQTASFAAINGNLSPLDDTQTAIGQYLSAKPAIGSIVAVDYVSDKLKVPPTFFTAVKTSTSTAPKNGGSVHVHHGFKRTSHTQWSDSQTLSPPAEFKEQSFFGVSISADRRTNRKLAVGCPGCNATAPDGGQVYLYSPSPNGLSWSQTQTLGLNANNYHDLGIDVSIHDDVLLASVQTPFNHKGYAVFQRGPAEGSSYQFQQILTNRGNITSADVFEDTIVLGNIAGTIGSMVAGEVQILYPSTEEFGLKPAGKPRPVQWSVQQVLHASDPLANGKFGGAVSIDRNTLVVSAAASASSKNVYVFQREEKGGMWSQQQTFAYSGVVGVSAAGNHFFASTSSLNSLFSTTDNWDCLVLSLEDQFGDDWDTAELIVSAPDGTRDFFSKGCDAGSSLKYRYCPNDRSEEGVYSFSIPEAIKAKHYWEITWRVFDENKGNWYIGQWDTKMDFQWDSDSLSFYPRKMDKVRTNTTCGGCPTKPTDKPTPVSRRNLKGSETHHPTVSPAPTLTISTVANWRSLSLITTGSVPWFNAYYQGTNYYVSDPHGHRLLHSGTACTAAGTTNCWLDLPDGDYNFRVGGGNDKNVAKRTFQYCKMYNDIKAGHQLSLRIRDGDCSVVSFASRDAVCQSHGYSILDKYSIILSVNMIVYGTTVSEAGSNERTVFSSAVASLFPGMQSNDVDLVSVASSGSGTFITANLKMSSDIGYNLLDYDEELAFETFIQNTFTSHDNELSLAAALTSGSVSSAFSRVTKVEFVDYQIVGSHEEIPASALSDLADEVTTYADTTTQSTTDVVSTNSSNILDTISGAGYFLAAFGVILAVGIFVVKRQSSSNTHLPVPEESEQSSKIEVGRRQLSQTSLTVGDLKELAHMEQEYLKIVAK